MQSAIAQPIAERSISLGSLFEDGLKPPRIGHDYAFFKIVHAEPASVPVFGNELPLPLFRPAENASRTVSFAGSRMSLLDGEKKLRGGIDAWLEGDGDKAKSILVQLAEKDDDAASHARIWLSWIALEENDERALAFFAESLKAENDYFYASEGFAIQTLESSRKGNDEETLGLVEAWETERPGEPVPFKLLYLALRAAERSGDGMAAENRRAAILRDYRHASLLPFVLENAGDRAYADGETDSALDYYDQVTELFPASSRFGRVRYKTAWTLYRKGNFKESSSILRTLTAEKGMTEAGEFDYLTLLLASGPEDGEEALRAYRRIPAEDAWKEAAALALLLKPALRRLDPAIDEEVLEYGYSSDRHANLALMEQAVRFAEADQPQTAKEKLLAVLETNADPQVGLYAEVNLAQSLMMLGEFEGTHLRLQEPFDNPEKELQRIYQLYHSLFRQGRFETLLRIDESNPYRGANRKIRGEVVLMKGVALAQTGRRKEALQLMEKAWRNGEYLQALGFAVHLRFLNDDFEEALKIGSENRGEVDFYLVENLVKSALALKRTDLARNYLKPFFEDDSETTRKLKIEIWQAENDDRNVIAAAEKWAAETENSAMRARYAVVAGDAFFNLGDYPNARKSYEKAKNSSESPFRESAFLGIMESAKLQGDEAGFVEEGNAALRAELTERGHLKVIEAMSAHFAGKKDYAVADRYLTEYLAKYSGNANRIRLARAELQLEAGNPSACVRLTENPWFEEDSKTASDRRLTGAACSLAADVPERALRFLEGENPTSQNYRQEERQLLLANASLRTAKYDEALSALRKMDSDKLPSVQKKEAAFIRIGALAGKEDWQSLLRMGTFEEDFKGSEKYRSTVLFRSRALWESGRRDEAVDLVSRNLYGVADEKDKALFRLKLSEYLLLGGDRRQAAANFKKIAPSLLNTPAEKELYLKISRSLSSN